MSAPTARRPPFDGPPGSSGGAEPHRAPSDQPDAPAGSPDSASPGEPARTRPAAPDWAPIPDSGYYDSRADSRADSEVDSESDSEARHREAQNSVHYSASSASGTHHALGPDAVPSAADVVAALTGTRYLLDERLDGRAGEPGGFSAWQTWRALDHRLARDVVVRVHCTGGSAAGSRVVEALKLGRTPHRGLARVDDAIDAGDRALIVSEYVPGPSLRQALLGGPMPDQAAATLVADVAEALSAVHHAGTAMGSIDVDHVVVSPTAAIVISSPQPGATVRDDVRALGALLQTCLSGRVQTPESAYRLGWAHSTLPGGIPAVPADGGSGVDDAAAFESAVPNDLAMVAARAADPDSPRGFRSAAAVATVLRQRATAPTTPDDPGRATPHTGAMPPGQQVDRGPRAPVNGYPPATPGTPANGIAAPRAYPAAAPAAARDSDGFHIGTSNPNFEDEYDDDYEDYDDEPRRSRVVAILAPVAALVAVAIVGWVIGIAVGNFGGDEDPTPSPAAEETAADPAPTGASASAPASSSQTPDPTPVATTGALVPIVTASVFDPQGQGDPDNTTDVPLAYDGDPGTAWTTWQYKRSAAFGNLKAGVGLLIDLGQPTALSTVTITTALPGSTVEIRAADQAGSTIDDFTPVVAPSTLAADNTLTVNPGTTARYVVVWITNLVPTNGQFQAGLNEVGLHS